MKIYLNHQLLQDSPITKAVLSFLERKEYVKVTIPEDKNKSSAIVLKITQGSEKLSNEEILNIILIDNMRNKLIDDYFIHDIRIPKDDKGQLALRDIYDGFISCSLLNQRYDLQLGFEEFTKAAKERNNGDINISDNVDQFLEKKKESLLKIGKSLKLKGADLTNLNDFINNIRQAKETKQKLKAQILYEKLKNEVYLNAIKEKFDTVCYSLKTIADFKTYAELENDSVDLDYQERIINNLKYYRQALEKKMMCDLYTTDQIAALKVVQELIQKKVNLLKTDKGYIQEKLEKQKKSKNDPRFGEILTDIFEVSKNIKKKERELAKLRNPQSY